VGVDPVRRDLNEGKGVGDWPGYSQGLDSFWRPDPKTRMSKKHKISRRIFNRGEEVWKSKPIALRFSSAMIRYGIDYTNHTGVGSVQAKATRDVCGSTLWQVWQYMETKKVVIQRRVGW
jgi:hypothetical protein